MEDTSKKNTLLLYHGNKDKAMRPRFGYGKKYNDYGRGFYTTPDIDLAREWACGIMTDHADNEAYVHCYYLDISGLVITDLSKNTEENVLHWLAELYSNRRLDDLTEVEEDRLQLFLQKYKEDTSSSDVINGYRADDSYFKYARDFLSSTIYYDTLVSAIYLVNLGLQYFIKSRRAFNDLITAEGSPMVIRGKDYEKYMHRYIRRDKIARNEYDLKKRNQRYILQADKRTITDFI